MLKKITYVILLMSIIFTACKHKPEIPTAPKIPNEVGNLQGNSGMATQGEWIYYLNPHNDSELYCMKADGSNKILLDNAHRGYYNINVVGETIFYATSPGNDIYSIKIDGTDKRLLADEAMASDIIATDDLIIYRMGYGGSDWRIHSMKHDGSDKRELSADASGPLLEDGLIYYRSLADNDKLYSMKTDGSDKRKVNDETDMGNLRIYKGRIYCTVGEDGCKIYSMNLDGTDKRKLNDEYSVHLKIFNERIYYCVNRALIEGPDNDNGIIHSMNLDGSDQRMLNSAVVWDFNIINDRIYYRKKPKPGEHFPEHENMKLDGTDVRSE